jgi:glutamate dehydrogenase (NAD(P)+)
VTRGGLAGRTSGTGIGVGYCVELTAARLGLPIAGARVAIQGFRNVGRATARSLADRGAVIVAISDIGGGVFCGAGLALAAVERQRRDAGTVADTPGTEAITNAELLQLDCDVLIPAALGGQITAENASAVRARLVAEAANNPTTHDADIELAERGITVIPDILCNSGGVIASYLEWVGGAVAAWDEAEFGVHLRERLRIASEEVCQLADERRLDYRLAAHVLAVDRVARATQSRGRQLYRQYQQCLPINEK